MKNVNEPELTARFPHSAEQGSGDSTHQASNDASTCAI